MRRLRAWWIRLTGLLTAGRLARQFDAELESHLEMHIDDNIRRGMTPGEARRQALIALGGPQSVREAYRERGGVPWLDSLAQDLRFAVRMLRKSPGFTAVAVIVLAVGMGATATVFSLVNALLLRPLNRGGDVELVSLYIGARTRPDGFRPFRYGEYEEIRDRSDAFEDVIAERRVRTGLTENGLTRRMTLTLASANYFSAFGVPMAAGRSFTRAEEQPESNAAVAVVAYRYWRARGLSPDIIGERLTLNNRTFEIIGVAGEGFNGTVPLIVSDVWLPLGASGLVGRDPSEPRAPVVNNRETPALLLAATLKRGVSAKEAQARLAPLAAALAAAYPESNRDHELVVQRRSRTGVGPNPSSDTEARMAGSALVLFSGLVLVVGCLNLANILLARGSLRQREIAIRLAIGGSRWRVIRQLLVEGFLISAIGGVAALAVAWLVASRVVASLSGIMPTAVTLDVSPDGRVVAMIAASCLLSTLFSCLGPAWRLSHLDLVSAIKSSGLQTPVRRQRIPLPSLLVAGQVCLSLALLVSAGVFLRASVIAASREPGFPLQGRLLADVDADLVGLDEANGRELYVQALEAVRAVPGVQRASAASIVPFGPANEARQVSRGSESAWPTFAIVGRDYFAAIGLPLIAGREFTAAEESSTASEPVAIVDEALVKRLFPDGNPLGHTLRVSLREDDDGEVVRIVGVVPSVADDILEPPGPHLYVPFGRHYRGGMTLLIRAAGGSDAEILASVRAAMQSVEGRPPILSLRTMEEHRDGTPSLWAVSLAARMFGAFGAIALVLATVGVYGLRAYLVSQRTREFGIRIALGATRGGVVGQLLRESGVIAAVGMGAGLALALAIVQLLRQSGMLYQVGAVDPLVFTIAPLLLALATAAASYLPARRVLRIDPAVALRPE